MYDDSGNYGNCGYTEKEGAETFADHGSTARAAVVVVVVVIVAIANSIWLCAKLATIFYK